MGRVGEAGGDVDADLGGISVGALRGRAKDGVDPDEIDAQVVLRDIVEAQAEDVGSEPRAIERAAPGISDLDVSDCAGALRRELASRFKKLSIRLAASGAVTSW